MSMPDDDERANCPLAGQRGHWLCGHCPDHGCPRHECGCYALIPQSPPKLPGSGEALMAPESLNELRARLRGLE